MFVYCGNNPVSRADNGGEFWQVVAGAAVGAALGAISEIAAQLINQAATGEAVDWGDVAISALGGAVYGGVMAATGSTVVASVASTVTTSVATGIKDGDPVEKIILDTVKETTIAAVTSAAPKIINKSLSGKYLKLNKFQQWLKDATADPFRGKYTREGNYLPYVFDEGLEDLRDSIAKSTIQALQSLN